MKRKEIKSIDRRRDENYGGRVASGTNGRKYAKETIRRKRIQRRSDSRNPSEPTERKRNACSNFDPKLTEKHYQKQGGWSENLKPSKRMRKVELGRKVKQDCSYQGEALNVPTAF